MNLTLVGYAIGFGLLGYLSGSLPFAVWVTHLVKGVDVRDSGSGHATTTNTIRQAGILPGVVVFILDVAKGFLPAWLALTFAPAVWIVPIAAVLAVVGHCWPVFAGFQGGMGLATAAGAMLAIAPLAVAICLGFLIVLMLILHHSARATVIAGMLFSPLLWLAGFRDQVIWIALGAGLVITSRFLLDWNRQYRELWLDREKSNLTVDE